MRNDLVIYASKSRARARASGPATQAQSNWEIYNYAEHALSSSCKVCTRGHCRVLFNSDSWTVRDVRKMIYAHLLYVNACAHTVYCACARPVSNWYWEGGGGGIKCLYSFDFFGFSKSHANRAKPSVRHARGSVFVAIIFFTTRARARVVSRPAYGTKKLTSKCRLLVALSIYIYVVQPSSQCLIARTHLSVKPNVLRRVQRRECVCICNLSGGGYLRMHTLARFGNACSILHTSHTMRCAASGAADATTMTATAKCACARVCSRNQRAHGDMLLLLVDRPRGI